MYKIYFLLQRILQHVCGNRDTRTQMKFLSLATLPALLIAAPIVTTSISMNDLPTFYGITENRKVRETRMSSIMLAGTIATQRSLSQDGNEIQNGTVAGCYNFDGCERSLSPLRHSKRKSHSECISILLVADIPSNDTYPELSYSP